jgi:hypothetical protein
MSDPKATTDALAEVHVSPMMYERLKGTITQAVEGLVGSYWNGVPVYVRPEMTPGSWSAIYASGRVEYFPPPWQPKPASEQDVDWLRPLLLKSLGLDETPPTTSGAEFGRWLCRRILKNFEGPSDEVVITQTGEPGDKWSRIVHRIKLSADRETVEIVSDVTMKPEGETTVITGTLT